jgi:hypothetical protein
MLPFRAMTAVALLAFCTNAFSLGYLENPQPGATESGISAITGWHCTSRNIEIRIDGQSLGKAGAGTSRADLASYCGGRTDNGFSLLYNFALLKGGTHRVDAYADGELFGSATFSVAYLGGEFLTGLSGAHRVPDFPAAGQGLRLAWSQARQGFVATGIEPLASGTLVGSYAIRQMYLFESRGIVFSTLEPGNSVGGTMTFRADGTYSMTFSVTMAGQTQQDSTSGPYSDHAYYVLENGAFDLVLERGETLSLLSMGPSGTGGWVSGVITAHRIAGTPAASDKDAPGGSPSNEPIGALLARLAKAR